MGFRPAVAKALEERCWSNLGTSYDCDRVVRELVRFEHAGRNRFDGMTLSRAERALIAMTTQERSSIRREIASCLAEVRAEEDESTGPLCSIVAVDPGRDRIGVVCVGESDLDWRYRRFAVPRAEEMTTGYSESMN